MDNYNEDNGFYPTSEYFFGNIDENYNEEVYIEGVSPVSSNDEGNGEIGDIQQLDSNIHSPPEGYIDRDCETPHLSNGSYYSEENNVCVQESEFIPLEENIERPGDIQEMETNLISSVEENSDGPSDTQDSLEMFLSFKRNESSSAESVPVPEEVPHAPLASMRPSKYANVDVKEVFPSFSPTKVPRFSILLGENEINKGVSRWKEVRQRHFKRKGAKLSCSSTEVQPKGKGLTFNYGPQPPVDQCMSDDEEKFLKPVEEEVVGEAQQEDAGEDEAAVWRNGPAKYWYDGLDLPDNPKNFDYGFKLRKPEEPEQQSQVEEAVGQITKKFEDPDEAFLMVSQHQWEMNVVWDGKEIEKEVNKNLASKAKEAGWLPTNTNRTASGQLANSTTSAAIPNVDSNGKVYSIFLAEDEDLLYKKWENETIWDAQNMVSIPKPTILTLDMNDENIIFEIPEDIDPNKQDAEQTSSVKTKVSMPHGKKSLKILEKAGVINSYEEEETIEKRVVKKDPFNISNDEFYMPKSELLGIKTLTATSIQHSNPTQQLMTPFIPTHLSENELRNFHRPPMTRYPSGPLSRSIPHRVGLLEKHIEQVTLKRETERMKSGGGDVFFMREPEDLSGKDGGIVLVEFSEQYPPLMNEVGMCSKIKNYSNKIGRRYSGPTDFKYGEMASAESKPFLGRIKPKETIQTLENNMYRAPIYKHDMPESDFLIIRTSQGYFIRIIDAIFLAGQQCPLYQVPGPNSKCAFNFMRDFLQVFIYRLFWANRDNPRRIKTDDIKRAFPSQPEVSIRRRLNHCADFKRTGMYSNYWVLKPSFRLPTDDEIRDMVSPEQYCAYFSMAAAKQRLKDAGYGEKSILTQVEDDDAEVQVKLEEEVKVAPWNTTRAYAQAANGKCLMQVVGSADPTGCGEGFSYVRTPNKPPPIKEEQEAQDRKKKIVKGTDADLRRLSLKDAQKLLKQFGVPEYEINKLSRWEIVDVVRTLSTEKAKAGEEGVDKFSRGNRYSMAEMQERYQQDCQRIFDLQNKVLASSEVLSTDEDDSSDEDSNDEEIIEMGKNLEKLLENKQTISELALENEEREREELRKMMLGEQEKSKSKNRQDVNGSSEKKGRVLRIERTVRDDQGKEYSEIEEVRNPAIIDAYLKIRTAKDNTSIQKLKTPDELQKEELRKERRRIMDQLRRIRKNEERRRLAQGEPACSSTGKSDIHDSSVSSMSTPGCSKWKSAKSRADLKMICGVCGQIGHMRTNKACPMYYQSTADNSILTKKTGEKLDRVRINYREGSVRKSKSRYPEALLKPDDLQKLPDSRTYLENRHMWRKRNENFSYVNKVNQVGLKSYGPNEKFVAVEETFSTDIFGPSTSGERPHKMQRMENAALFKRDLVVTGDSD